MKAHNYYIHYKLIIVLFLLAPVCSTAAVKEVTLFPDSAKISEITKVHPQCSDKCRAIITLPPQADPESLVVSLPPQSRVKIEDLQAKPIQVQDEARIAELRKQIAGAEGEKKETQAKLDALEAQLQFWQAQTKAKTKTVADSYKLADAMGEMSTKPIRKNSPPKLSWKKSKKILKNFRKN